MSMERLQQALFREEERAQGLAMQLSQGQDRQPLAPEGAPPAADVRRLQAGMKLW
jgi:hypothetical protein